MTIRNIIFDLDGTLIDSAPSILESLEIALASEGLAPRQNVGAHLIGPPLRSTLARLAGPCPPEQLDRLCAAFMAHYDRAGYRASKPYPGAGDLLSELAKRGCKLFIATNKRSKPTRLILEHLEWHCHFSGVYSSDTFSQPAQSKAELLAHVLAKHALDKASTLYVGDRREDLDAAHANCVLFYAAHWGYSDDMPAEYECKSPTLEPPLTALGAMIIPLIPPSQAPNLT
ncbi:MAG: hypothetical protein RIR70_340 [Pseudomonadota bacterium]|jgi:phosphoglycolate phosphatase